MHHPSTYPSDLHDTTKLSIPQHVEQPGDRPSKALMAACERALDSVRDTGAHSDHSKVDISKELHALEAEILRACVLSGTGAVEIPWQNIMHGNSQSSHAVSGRESLNGSSISSIAADTSTPRMSVDIDRELTSMVKDTLVAVSSGGGTKLAALSLCIFVLMISPLVAVY
jgi:hypothetical protein